MRPGAPGIVLTRSGVDRILARHGLIRGPRLLRDRRATATADPESSVSRLSAALIELGPTACLFGRYLSTRLDLLPIAEASVLGSLPGSAPAKALDLGARFEQRFAAVDRRPCAEGLAWVAYRALTTDGRSVEARKFDPQAIDTLHREAHELEAGLAKVLGSRPWDLPFERLWSDFRARDLEPRLEPRAHMERFERLAIEADQIDGLRIPRLDPQHSTDGLWVLSMPPAAAAAETEEHRRYTARSLARRAVEVWLQMALVAGIFPVSARWMLDHRGRVVLVDGTFAELGSAHRPRVWDYLRSLARQEPDRCFQILTQELKAPAGWGTLEQLRDLRAAFRYSVPFRDGSWTRAGDSLAEMAAHHWRACNAAGLRVEGGWGECFRALVLRSRESQPTGRAQPGHTDPDDHDALRHALEALQWRAGWNQLSRLTEPRALPSAAKQYAAAMLDLPQALERLLDPKPPPAPAVREPASHSRDPSASTQGVIGGLLGLVAIAMALPAVTFLDPRLEIVGVALMILLAGLIGILIYRGPTR